MLYYHTRVKVFVITDDLNKVLISGNSPASILSKYYFKKLPR